MAAFKTIDGRSPGSGIVMLEPGVASPPPIRMIALAGTSSNSNEPTMFAS